MKQPFLKGSILEPLIRMRMDDGTEGEFTAMSWGLDRLGTVNSDARREPKYPKEQAAQNIT